MGGAYRRIAFFVASKKLDFERELVWFIQRLTERDVAE